MKLKLLKTLFLILAILVSTHSYSQYSREQKELIANKLLYGKACCQREFIKDSIIDNLNSTITVFSLQYKISERKSQLKDSLILQKQNEINQYNEEIVKKDKLYKKTVLFNRIINVSLLLVISFLVLK